MTLWAVYLCFFHTSAPRECVFAALVFWKLLVIKIHALTFQTLLKLFHSLLFIILPCNFLGDFYGSWIKLTQHFFTEGIYLIWCHVIGCEIG